MNHGRQFREHIRMKNRLQAVPFVTKPDVTNEGLIEHENSASISRTTGVARNVHNRSPQMPQIPRLNQNLKYGVAENSISPEVGSIIKWNFKSEISHKIKMRLLN